MISTIIYGRPITTWLLYQKLPLFFGNRLYIIMLDEADVRSRSFHFLSTNVGKGWYSLMNLSLELSLTTVNDGVTL